MGESLETEFDAIKNLTCVLLIDWVRSSAMVTVTLKADGMLLNHLADVQIRVHW